MAGCFRVSKPFTILASRFYYLFHVAIDGRQLLILLPYALLPSLILDTSVALMVCCPTGVCDMILTKVVVVRLSDSTLFQPFVVVPRLDVLCGGIRSASCHHGCCVTVQARKEGELEPKLSRNERGKCWCKNN